MGPKVTSPVRCTGLLPQLVRTQKWHMMKVLVMVLVMLTSHGVNGFAPAKNISAVYPGIEEIGTYDYMCNLRCASAATLLAVSCAGCFFTPDVLSCAPCVGLITNAMETCGKCPATLCIGGAAIIPPPGAWPAFLLASCTFPKDNAVYQLCEFCGINDILP